MKIAKLIFAFILLVAASMGSAWADRGGHGHRGGGHAHFGLIIGVPWGPWYYPPPYYYPPLVVERQVPQVYIEQTQEPAAPLAAAPANYWYYCAAARAYYPYVKECTGGWQKVLPQPPGQP